MPPKGTGPANPSIKRKPLDKTDRLLKKPKVTAGSAVEENPNAKKLPHLPGIGKGKGFMTGQGPVTEKCPVLLREDS